MLRKAETQRFHHRLSCDTQHTGLRYGICGTTKSNLRNRELLPRAIQTLYSRWRLGQVESCGTYPRKLKFVQSAACRFCDFPCETTIHLLTDCPGTALMRTFYGISLDTLRCDSCRNILAIAYFDAFIRRALPFDSQPPNQQLLSSLLYDDNGRPKRDVLIDDCSVKRSRKRQRTDKKHRLVIPIHQQSTPPPKRTAREQNLSSLQ